MILLTQSFVVNLGGFVVNPKAALYVAGIGGQRSFLGLCNGVVEVCGLHFHVAIHFVADGDSERLGFHCGNTVQDYTVGVNTFFSEW
jgi:hypothetical protein